MIKVFIVCSGLGQIKRGFESFTQECFDTLLQESSLDIHLFKSGGEISKAATVLWNISRTTAIANKIGKLIGRNAYFVEQMSYFLSLLPYIYFQKPDVVYFSDGNLGNLLWHWRRLSNQDYKLLFSNGGPLSPPFDRWDHVQQVAPVHLETALKAGAALETQSLLPYGLHISAQLQILTTTERVALRSQLSLPADRTLILSVGAINKSHKRMDYLIHEVATLPEPRPYLLLIGQQEVESPEIQSLGNQLLGKDNFQIRTVAPEEVKHYYKSADVFVLASLGEGLPRALLEAASYGLPCLAHDYEVTRFILGDGGYLTNLEIPAHLSGLIAQALVEKDGVVKRELRHYRIYEQFSWEKLCPRYVEMIHRCAALATEARSPITSTTSSKL